MAGVATHGDELPRGSTTTALERATAAVEAPFALVDLDAMWPNGEDMLRRAGGKPIRVASQVAALPRRCSSEILARDPGLPGLLTYTLPEALWLAAHGFDDLVVGYPTADRAAIAELGRLTDGAAATALRC